MTLWPGADTEAGLSSPSTTTSIVGINPPIFTKDQYTSILRENRRKIMHQHFARGLEGLYARLREDAVKSKPCHREATFEIPDHLNLETMERLICEYFQDLGYKPLKEPRKEGETKITITLT